MNVHVHKNRVTSRRSSERHNVPESHNSNITTFQRVEIQRRDVPIQRRNVLEKFSKSFIFQLRDVTESCFVQFSPTSGCW